MILVYTTNWMTMARMVGPGKQRAILVVIPIELLLQKDIAGYHGLFLSGLPPDITGTDSGSESDSGDCSSQLPCHIATYNGLGPTNRDGVSI